MEEIQKLIGMRIKQLRKAKLISQEQLALLSGLDRTYVNSVENGRRNISIVNINRLAIALDCDLNYFFDSAFFKRGGHDEQEHQ